MFWLNLIKFLIAVAILVIIMLVGIEFFFVNSHIVTVNYVLDTQEWPLAWVVVTAFAVGVLITLLASLFIIIPLRWRVGRLQRLVGNREQEIDILTKRSNVSTPRSL